MVSQMRHSQPGRIIWTWRMGDSSSSSCEVIRDGLRLLEEDQQRRQAVIDGLRGEIERGRRSGKPKPAAEVLDRLERKYSKMAKERAK